MTNYMHGYNSFEAAAINLFKDAEKLASKRGKLNEQIGETRFHWMLSLICYAATEHFVARDGDGKPMLDKPKYTDKLAVSFRNDFLAAKVGIQGDRQLDKYTSVVSAVLGIRKLAATVDVSKVKGIRPAALEGPETVAAYLAEQKVDTLNGLIAMVQPGADPIMAIATRVAKMDDESRAKFNAALALAESKLKREAEKASKAKATDAKAKDNVTPMRKTHVPAPAPKPLTNGHDTTAA